MTRPAPFWQPADWTLPPGVRAGHTLRAGGVSQGPWAASDGSGGLNLGAHCGDDAEAVRENRRRLTQALPAAPVWLDQVHGTRVHAVTAAPAADGAPVPGTDAACTTRPGVVLAVMSADCLPVLVCDAGGVVIGAAHAGWRGLASGVVENLVAAMRASAPVAQGLRAWLGPAIGPAAFEVGDEVLAAFEAHDPAARQCFVPGAARGKWMADLFGLARQRLHQAGVASVAGGGQCTVGDPTRYYSYRRDRQTGRLATLIWREPDVTA